MVVSYRNSTSNHNDFRIFAQQGIVVSYRNSTSNHNSESVIRSATPVVSYRNSTSNHNGTLPPFFLFGLYLIEILHQTTTLLWASCLYVRCILSKFYIKPQPRPGTKQNGSSCILSKFYIKPQHLIFALVFLLVVSYRNSTSNHNNARRQWRFQQLYLIEILHQTTTRS